MGGGGATPMVYAVPGGNPLTFERGDSMEISIQSGFGSFEMEIEQAMTLEVTFERSAGGVQATTVIRAYSGRMTNPLAAPVTVSEGDIEGDLVFTVDGRGHANVLSSPEVSTAAQAIFNAVSLAHDMFPMLPEDGVGIGASWVDSTSYSSNEGGNSIEVTWVGTSTLVGDTVVDGRTLTLVRTEAEVSIEVAMQMAGVNVSQSMSGPETGFYLWDPARRTVVYQEASREFSGTVNAAVAPGPMDLSATQRIRMALVGG